MTYAHKEAFLKFVIGFSSEFYPFKLPWFISSMAEMLKALSLHTLKKGVSGFVWSGISRSYRQPRFSGERLWLNMAPLKGDVSALIFSE